MFAAVIFDLFGTLVEERVGDAHPEMARQLGVSQEVLQRHWGPHYRERMLGRQTFMDSVERVCREAGLAASADMIAEAAGVRAAAMRKSLASPRPGAPETLAFIRKTGLPVGLLSNASPDLSQAWASFPLHAEFDTVVFSADVGLMKPDLEIFRLVAARLSVDPKQCLYVGDGSDRELEGAASLV